MVIYPSVSAYNSATLNESNLYGHVGRAMETQGRDTEEEEEEEEEQEEEEKAEEIVRAHDRTLVTIRSRMPSSA